MSLQDLLDREQYWPTAMGRAFLTERVVMRGKDLHHDLGNRDWFSLYVFSILGRTLSEAQTKMLNYIWVATSYPDPSIWPNHVTALGGSVQTTASLALTAGNAVSEAAIYGRRPERKALDFFRRAGRALDEGQSLPTIVEGEIKRRKVLYGYGRPLDNRLDERIPHTLHKMRELGLDKGKHVKLALDVYRYLKRSRGLSMNIAALNTALVTDMGFTPEEYQLFMFICFIGGMVPCYIEARDRPEGSFFPIRCDNVTYGGPAQRSWDG